MFGRKLMKGGGSSGVGARARPKSPRDVLIERIEQVTPGQEVAFRLPPIYGSDIIVVEANKDYPGKGHKFAVASADPVEGKPGPNRRHIWEADKAKPIADWILARNGEPIA